MTYFWGQGKAYLGLRDTNGDPLFLTWVGDCTELKLGLNLEFIEHQECYTGQRATVLKIVSSKSTEFNMTLKQFTNANFALGLQGVVNSIAAGTAITGEVLGGSTTPTVGQVYVAKKRNGTAIAVKDSTGTPKTLTLNTNYEIEPYSMTITMLNTTTGGPFTGPLKVDYTPGISSEISMFNAPQQDYFMRFVGLNLADSGKIVTVDLWKLNISPTSELSMIGDDLADLQITGAALIDPKKPSNSTLGQFGAVYRQD